MVKIRKGDSDADIDTASVQQDKILRRTVLVCSILGLSLISMAVTSITLLFSGLGSNEAMKAIISINILAVLLAGMSVYSLVGIFWNAYWVQRGNNLVPEAARVAKVRDAMIRLHQNPEYLSNVQASSTKPFEAAMVAAEMLDTELASDALVQTVEPSPFVRAQTGSQYMALRPPTAGTSLFMLGPPEFESQSFEDLGLLRFLMSLPMRAVRWLRFGKYYRNPDDITRSLQVPLIGHIPVITQGKVYLVEGSLIEPIVCTYHRPKSQVSEAFRAVRTALYFNTQGKQNSVIQVTSPTPGDGKSTLASNLAVSIAQSGKRVLLVDADLRHPRQHTTFGISSKVGFATFLSGQSEWRNCMFECEEIEGLTIMPCGTKPQNAAELSLSPKVKVLIEEMREEFDYVIIDTPPMLAVTNPSPIVACVDGVILCIQIKKNVRVSAERAHQLIQNLGANVIGLLVNRVGAKSGYGSHYTYGAYRAGYSYTGYGYGTGGIRKYYDEDQPGRSSGEQVGKNEPFAKGPVVKNR